MSLGTVRGAGHEAQKRGLVDVEIAPQLILGVGFVVWTVSAIGLAWDG